MAGRPTDYDPSFCDRVIELGKDGASKAEMAAEIYALCEPETGDVRYVGKANNSVRRLAAHLREARTERTPKDRWLMSLARAGKAPVLRILMTTEDWEADERRLIAEHRKSGRLLNIADGGRGAYASKPYPRGAFFKLMHRFQSFINEGATQFIGLKAAHKAQRREALKHVTVEQYDAWLNDIFGGKLS